MYKQLFNVSKWVISIALVIVIFRYYFKMDQWSLVWQQLKNTPFYIFIMCIVIALFNWYLESIKWRIMISNIEQISPKTAFASTLAGSAVANIIPFRVGEYLGRMIYISKENRIPSAVNSIVGSMAQMTVTLVMGIPFVSIMVNEKYQTLARYGILALIGLFIAGIAISLWVRKRRPGKSKLINKIIQDLKSIRVSQLVKAVGISFARYFVFSSMYVFLLYYFGVSSNIMQLFGGVATVFFIQSFAPGMVLVDAGIRTSIPLIVFTLFTQNKEPQILTAATINYAFNVFFPALTGTGLLLYKKSTDLEK